MVLISTVINQSVNQSVNQLFIIQFNALKDFLEHIKIHVICFQNDIDLNLINVIALCTACPNFD